MIQPTDCCSWWVTCPVGDVLLAVTTQHVGKAFVQFGAACLVAEYVNDPLSR